MAEHNWRHEDLPTLARALERKYPGVVVTEAAVCQYNDEQPFRRVQFDGPWELLVKYGLVPPNADEGECVDEFGGAIRFKRDVAVHLHKIDTGALRGANCRSHPENSKTRTAVARILKRFTSKASA